MRIMAADAIHNGRVDRDMGFLERVPLLVMALSAERLDGFNQQPFFRRNVRLVTGQAIARRGRVRFFLAHSFLQALMARQAHIGGRRYQQFGHFGLMGTVALRA
jgi:hypothetical protein